MSDTSKAKGLFMAQYLGQQFVYQYTSGRYSPPSNVTAEYLWIWEDNPGNEPVLLLRSIEQLTDEEYITCFDMLFNNSGYTNEVKVDLVKGWCNLIDKESGGYLPKNYFSFGSYLLRIGILLPFTYLNEENKPITLTPEEIIKLGWAKLRTELNIQL